MFFSLILYKKRKKWCIVKVIPLSASETARAYIKSSFAHHNSYLSHGYPHLLFNAHSHTYVQRLSHFLCVYCAYVANGQNVRDRTWLGLFSVASIPVALCLGRFSLLLLFRSFSSPFSPPFEFLHDCRVVESSLDHLCTEPWTYTREKWAWNIMAVQHPETWSGN